MTWTIVAAGYALPTQSLNCNSKRQLLCYVEILIEEGYTKFHITQNT